jgi:hypothetical protein
VRTRSSLLVASVVGLAFGAVAPAQASATDPVANLSASVTQTLGSHASWTIATSWTANDTSTSYSVSIVPSSDGSGVPLFSKEVTANQASLVVDNLSAGTDYWVAVRSDAQNAAVVTTEIAPQPLDVTGPSGTFAENRNSGYLTPDFDTFKDLARFTIKATGGDPFSTRKVLPGGGVAAINWPTGSSLALTYIKAGTYTPQVQLADQYGNTHAISLPTIHVLADTTAPKVAIARPSSPGKIASWRTIRGTTSDIGTGVALVGTYVWEKRGKIWYGYDFSKKKWLKGYASFSKTSDKVKSRPDFVDSPRANWHTASIRGLTKGTIRIQVIALDNEFNDRVVRANHAIR